MSPRRRLGLLSWARRAGAVVIEDDYDSEFVHTGRPVDPLYSLDRDGRVVYVGSFSRTLLATLRLAYCVAPPSLYPAIRKAKYLVDWHTPLVTQVALARFMGDGLFAPRRIAALSGTGTTGSSRRSGASLMTWAELVLSGAGLHLRPAARRGCRRPRGGRPRAADGPGPAPTVRLRLRGRAASRADPRLWRHPRRTDRPWAVPAASSTRRGRDRAVTGPMKFAHLWPSCATDRRSSDQLPSTGCFGNEHQSTTVRGSRQCHLPCDPHQVEVLCGPVSKGEPMSRSVRWASKALLTLVVTSMVLVGLGQAAHAGPPPSSPASAPAPALAAASGQYAVELTPDGRMTIRGTNALPASRAGAQAATKSCRWRRGPTPSASP